MRVTISYGKRVLSLITEPKERATPSRRQDPIKANYIRNRRSQNRAAYKDQAGTFGGLKGFVLFNVTSRAALFNVIDIWLYES